MALRFQPEAGTRLAADLRAFFQPHGMQDAHFDEWCGWLPGTTRQFLDRKRLPSDREMIELCARMKEPLSRYVQCYMPDYARHAPRHCPCHDRDTDNFGNPD